MSLKKKIKIGLLAGMLGFGTLQAKENHEMEQVNQVSSQIVQNQNNLLEFRKQGNGWYGDQRDEILREILNKYLQNDNSFSTFTNQDAQNLLEYRRDFEEFIKSTSNYTYNDVSDFLRNLNWIALNLENQIHGNQLKENSNQKTNISTSTNSNSDIQENFNEQEIQVQQNISIENRLKLLLEEYHKTNRFSTLSYGNKEIFKYIENNQIYDQLLEERRRLNSLRNQTQRQKDYIYVISRITPFYAFENRKISIESYLKNTRDNTGIDISRNVANPHNNIDIFLGHELINFSSLNPNFSARLINSSKEKNVNLRVLTTISLIENNYGGNRTSSADAYGPFQVKQEIINRYGKNRSTSFDNTYIAGVNFISALIQRYNLNLHSNIVIPNLSTRPFNTLNSEEKQIVIDFLTLLSMYYDGEGGRFINARGELTTQGGDGGSLAYIQKGINGLNKFFGYDTQRVNFRLPYLTQKPEDPNIRIL